ncbi:MAG: glucokinase [Melioribacteraceae bacterium]|nr:MAG: glucokinase [Melioribacteraceae bacterium]
MKKHIITIDLGGTKILTALIDENANIVARDKVPTDMSKGHEYLVELITGTVKSVLEQSSLKEDDIRAIAMGVPGTVNPITGIIGNAPNLGIENYNIKEAVEKNFNIPVLIENDVNLAALGIKYFEFKNDVNNMLVVFVGTGIGGALIFNNALFRGSTYFAGEIGHMRIDDQGNLASGKKGSTSFETLASRTGIVNLIKKDIKDGQDSIITKLAGKKGIKSKVLATAVAEKDKVAVKRVKEACDIIGTVLGSIVTLTNIDTIVLGGGVVEAMGDYMKSNIEKAFRKAVLKEPGEACKIVVTELGDDAPLYGGLSLAEEFLS